jgi:cytochrome P450
MQAAANAWDERIPRLDLDPYDDAALIEPYSIQALLRDAGPVAWLTRYECYAAARHAVVFRILQEPGQFSSAAGVSLANLKKPGAWRAQSPLVESDPPQHTVIRATMNRILSPSVIRSWREVFAAEAVGFCARVLEQGEFDGLHDLALPFVQKVFPTVMGMEPNPRNFLIVGHHNANAAGPKNHLFEKSQAELESIMDWYLWSQTPQALLPGGFGEQIFAAERAGELPAGTAGPVMRTLVRGGLDTTISGISSTLLYLARNPRQFERVKSDPALVVAAFEEALRLESPTNSVYRTTTAIAEIEGIALRPEEKVLLCIGAANRDPRQWPDADQYRVERRARNSLIFGGGVHNCLGQRTARLEAECLLTELIRRIRSIELAGEPAWQAINALRTLDRLPLKITLN